MSVIMGKISRETVEKEGEKVKLEQMFYGTLNSSTIGLAVLIKKIEENRENIKKAVEDSNLELLRLLIAEGHDCVRKLETFFVHTESKIASFTTTEDGKIIDLSVPPEQRN